MGLLVKPFKLDLFEIFKFFRMNIGNLKNFKALCSYQNQILSENEKYGNEIRLKQ